MQLNSALRPPAKSPPLTFPRAMHLRGSTSSTNVAPSRTLAARTSRQLAGHAHTSCCDSTLAAAPLHRAWHQSAPRRQPRSLVHCAVTRSRSFSSASWLQLSPHAHSFCSDGRRALVRGLRQRPSGSLSSSRSVRLQQPSAAGSSSGGRQSVDDDEEGDAGVTQELEAYEVERFRQMGRHLELMWTVGKKPAPAPCDCCEGSGSRNCRYCNNTGAMMVGHERFCSLEQGCKPCPICNGTGEVKCSHCQGTGYRAGWLERGCPVEQ